MSQVHLVGGVARRLLSTSQKPPNTPLQASRSQSGHVSSRSHSDPVAKRKEYGDALGYYVAEELATSVFCEIPGFFENIFPVSQERIDAVYKAVSKAGRNCAYDTSTKRWLNYNFDRPARESVLYNPFVQLVETIVDRLPKLSMKANGLRWRDHHDSSPVARDPHLPDIRPDIVATLGVSKASSEIPWSRIVVPVEVKKQSAVDFGPALLQLLKYVRLIFREAVDRCFILGIVLAHANMSVYLADRTGVIGSKVFNIHDQPKTLIRVIVGLSTLGLSDLGLDTTMTVITQRKSYTRDLIRNLSLQPSYKVRWDKEHDKHYWIIEMPKPKVDAEFGVMDEVATEKFVLYKGVSLSRGGVIRGRATRVWKAWLLEDMHLPQKDRRLFIVKDSWRDDERPLEGEFYQRIGRADGVAVMRSYGIVRVNGKEDKVSSRVRRMLAVKGRTRCIDMPQRDPKPETIPELSPDRERKNITQYFYAYDYLPMLDTPEYSPRSKTHSRLVMETYGWSIKYALSLVELVQAVKDALKGYQAAYQKNVIHRDMSVENILITRLTEEGKRGVIIDFDYAKVLGDPTLYDDPASGTRPFMSGELLIGRPYFNAVRREVDGVQVVVFDDSAPRHAFYHDLESVLWILLWICLSKNGGGIRRHALVHKTDDSLDRLFRGLYEVPEIEQLGRSKREVLKDEMEFSYAIRYIDDFYRPLEPLLWKLWHILHTGYKTHDFRFEETFPRFLSAFDEAEQLLKDSPPPTLTEGQLANVDKERQRREKDEIDWQHSPRPVIKTTRQPMQPVIQENQDEILDDDDAFADETRDSSPTPGADAANLDDLELGRRPARGRGREKTGALSTTRATGIVTRSMSRSSPAAASSSRAESPPSSIASQSTVKQGSGGRTRGDQATRDGHDDAGGKGNKGKGKGKGKGKAAQGDGGTRGRRGKGGRGRGKGKPTKGNATSDDS